MKVLQKIALSAVVSTLCLASSQTPGQNILQNDSLNVDRTLQRTVSGLQMFEVFNGPYGLSTDGYGGYDNDEGTISAKIPVNSIIEKAYLYAAGVGTSGSVNDVKFAGTTLDYDETTVWSGESYYTGREDVTAIVKTAIANGACVSDICDFPIEELGYNDGEALVVVYRNSSLPTSTIAILDGHANMSGDSTVFNLTEAIDKAKPGFFAHMYLGISYSYSSGYSFYQTSDVKVNGQTLTTMAGSQDDGYDSNGGLITVGSYDDPFSPIDPEGADDHEKYDLTPLLTNGETSIKVDTYNSSQDDNIFLAVFHLSQKTDSVYIDGGPIVNGPSEYFAKPGDSVTLNYDIINSATAPIDINLSIDSNLDVSFTDTTLINSNYDVNSTKNISLTFTVPSDATSEFPYYLKLKALGNEINALKSTQIIIEQSNLFADKVLSQGWNLLGSDMELNVNDIQESLKQKGFDLKMIYKYDTNGWKAYSPYSVISDRITIPTFDFIGYEKGFWVYLDPITQ